MDFSDIGIGMINRQEFLVSEERVKAFAELTGDMNPVHLDEEFARTTQFGRRIAHGMLVASFISKVLGRDFPGDGTIYVSQKVRFRRPVFIGDKVTVEVEVTEKNDEKKRLILRTDVISESGEKVIIGEAEVMKP
ncbi:MAG TPA: MaoC family dehydratase [Thermotogota bacterium]|jgi:3-hydroxybutyryl-CoA dehydratase|nr:MaoC family dehydratase [Thermotogota bacterium]NLZ13425.1 MaoC family dehydratase [Thermotogaceae bacterium]HNR62638.1 MaoC family dehydratase [Thermotogota bacterium]HNT94644.1 MaoC family dehydratase [Thermotogota bacterium]HOZ11017.1 MaoC family dehydratase [Thermotogota bacterium]